MCVCVSACLCVSDRRLVNRSLPGIFALNTDCALDKTITVPICKYLLTNVGTNYTFKGFEQIGAFKSLVTIHKHLNIAFNVNVIL